MARHWAILLPFILSGCAATLRAYTERSTRKEAIVDGEDRRTPPVAGVSINASRRLIIAADRKAGGHEYYTCSEPAPDTALNEALQTAASATVKTKGTEASAALSDTAILTNVILAQRTELVELWRTTGFQYCQLRMNGDPIGAAEYLKAAAIAMSKVGVSAANVAAAVREAAAAQHQVSPPLLVKPGEQVLPVPPVHAGPTPAPTP